MPRSPPIDCWLADAASGACCAGASGASCLVCAATGGCGCGEAASVVASAWAAAWSRSTTCRMLGRWSASTVMQSWNGQREDKDQIQCQDYNEG